MPTEIVGQVYAAKSEKMGKIMKLPLSARAVAGLLLLAPLAAACGASSTPGQLTTGAAPRWSAEPDLPIFTNPHGGDVHVPAQLLAQELRDQLAADAAASAQQAITKAAAASVPAAGTPAAGTTSSSTPVGGPAAAQTPSAGAGAAPAPSATDWNALYEKVRPSVGLVEAPSCNGDSYIGTAFVIAPDLALTDYHVVSQSGPWTLRLQGKPMTVSVIGFDAAEDVALLRLPHAVSVPALSLRQSFPKVGSHVGAIGYALGLGEESDAPSLTVGTVSGVDRRYTDLGGHDHTGMVQADFNSNHGDSGGPVVASDGSVVGMVDLIIGDHPQNTNLAVGSPLASKLVAKWRKSSHPVSTFC